MKLGQQSTLNDIKDLASAIEELPDSKYITVSGVIRYYKDLDKWDLIQNHTGGHKPVNISSVSSDSSKIAIKFDTDDIEGLEVSSFIISPDETLARNGVFCGGSVSVSGANVYMSHSSMFVNIIRYDGDSFSAQKNYHQAVWDNENSELVVSMSGAPHMADFLIGNMWPTVSSKGGYSPVLRSIGSEGELYVKYYTQAGELVSTPDPKMDLWVSDPRILNDINPNLFPDGFGNLWFIGQLSKA